MWSSDDLSGALSGDSEMRDGMRGALGATFAALRAYRRASQATSKRRVMRSRGGVSAPAMAGTEELSGEPPRSHVRRSLIAIIAGSMLAVAALVATAVAVFDLAATQPGQPRTVIEPYGAGPAATSSVAPVAGTATGLAPTDPLSVGSTAGSSASSGAVVAGGSASAGSGSGGADSPAASASAAPANSPVASPSPSLVDLCRSVVAAGNSWPSVIRGADRTTLIAAAGTKKNVLPYCTGLVAGTT